MRDYLAGALPCPQAAAQQRFTHTLSSTETTGRGRPAFFILSVSPDSPHTYDGLRRIRRREQAAETDIRQIRGPHQAGYAGYTETGLMEIPRFTELLEALRAAETEGSFGLGPDSRRTPARSLALAHHHVTLALAIAESVLTGQECALHGCRNPIQYKGTGRPAEYCGLSCRDRAAYRKKREEAQRDGD